MIQNHRINLISDTVTRPTAEMLEFMMHAELGDDVFSEDPTVIKLENKLATMFGHEAGLFCPSGTMTNQIALKGHTNPLDELICEINSHVYQYEVGGYAFHSGIAINPLTGPDGKLNSELIEQAIKPNFDWLPTSKLVVIENTGNRTGGNFYYLEEIQAISHTCKSNNLKLHLDGARIFNAVIAANYTPNQIGPYFDSISICLSKGLGAPVGSVLIGPYEWIKKCRKIRKVMGGGMRQAGIIAAGGLYALDHHIKRLTLDHNLAALIEECLKTLPYIAHIKKVYTNIIIFDLVEEFKLESFLNQLKQNGINASTLGKRSVRFVTHLDISKPMIDELIHVLRHKINPF